MDYLKSEIDYLVMAGWLPKSKVEEAYSVAKGFFPSKGEDQVIWKVGSLAQTKAKPYNPIGYLITALKGLPDVNGIAIDQRLVQIARTKWTDEDD